MGFRSPLGRLGRQVGLRRALWAEKGELTGGMETADVLGPSWRLLPEVILEGFLGRPGREA